MSNFVEARRRFMAHFTAIGLGSTLVPGIIWARMQDAEEQTITLEMVADAMKLSGIELSTEDLEDLVNTANRNLDNFEENRKTHIPNDVSPPFHFSSIAPGIEVDKIQRPIRYSDVTVTRPANLEDVAFWSVRNLAELIRTRQVTSVELTQMCLDRLHRYQPTLNFVVTFLDELGLDQARQADREIAAGNYKGPLHGIPWGSKDIISVKDFPTTWGSEAFRDQVFDSDASVVEMLRDAGAVLVAKLSTGELAAGDNWFGGQTKNPWDPEQGSSGSSAGPASATAAGCVGFAIGSETSGSILSPSSRCGVAGLRPTFGRISRYGVMALSWTQDRLGPLCRYAEDCAIVMEAIAKPDGRDMSVSDIPFNWDASFDITGLRVGYIKESFDDITNATVKQNADATLDTLRSMGVSEFIPMTIPETPGNGSAIGVESTVFFDEKSRTGQMENARGGARNSSRLIPAVEYLQAQRMRMMMMTGLAKATEGIDVYVVASAGRRGGGRGGRGARGGRGGAGAEAGGARGGAGAEAGGARGAAARGGRGGRGGGAPQTPARRHSNMANLACYPAINVPNGFSETGTPTNVTFFARPFREFELLALAKAYQDAAGFHLRTPNLSA